MDENQEAFISWIAAKLEATDEQDLQKKLKLLGNEGIKQAYDEFLRQDVASKREGGKLEYIKCLQEFKKGGKIGCGCMGGMIPMKKEDGGSLIGNSPNFEKKKKGKWSKLQPKKVVMGQGMGTITAVKSNQEGGQLQPNAIKGKQPAGQNGAPSKGKGQPSNGQQQNQQGQMQGPTPEQIQEQKVDEKAGQLLNKKLGQGEANTPEQQLRMLLQPKQIKAKKEKTMKLVSNNGILYGIAK